MIHNPNMWVPSCFKCASTSCSESKLSNNEDRSVQAICKLTGSSSLLSKVNLSPIRLPCTEWKLKRIIVLFVNIKLVLEFAISLKYMKQGLSESPSNICQLEFAGNMPTSTTSPPLISSSSLSPNIKNNLEYSSTQTMQSQDIFQPALRGLVLELQKMKKSCKIQGNQHMSSGMIYCISWASNLRTTVT
jgi:hypothetical protein